MTSSLSAQIKRIKLNSNKIITPRLDKWLVQHPEGIVVPLDDPNWYALVGRLLSMPNHDRANRFGASGRGRCQRRQVFDYLDMPGLRTNDSIQQNVFNDGTFRHIRWQLMGVLAGLWPTDGVEAVATLPQYNVKVSMDAVNWDEAWGFELKGMSWMSKFLKEGLSDYHNGQVHTMMLAANLDRFVFVAEHKQHQSWVEMIIERDPKWIRKVKSELNALSDAIEDRKLPEPLPACKAHKGDDFRGCQYSGNCLEQDSWPA